jgi:hypothetical protein
MIAGVTMLSATYCMVSATMTWNSGRTALTFSIKDSVFGETAIAVA